MTKELEKNQRHIYILLSRTNTIIATLVRWFTGQPYSHTSISLDLELRDLYSFARRKLNNPLTAGFTKEDIESGVFGADDRITCIVYKVPVTEDQFERIEQEITRFKDNPDYYKYNFIGLFAGILRLNLTDGKHFTCSAFVDHVLVAGGIQLFKNRKKLVKPYDFHFKLEKHELYEGRLCEYREYLKKEDSIDGNFAKAI